MTNVGPTLEVLQIGVDDRDAPDGRLRVRVDVHEGKQFFLALRPNQALTLAAELLVAAEEGLD